MAYDSEPVELGTRNLQIGTKLFLAADAFVFLAFLFAYVYLRALNSHGMWHPAGVNPTTALGAVTVVAMVVATGASMAATRSARSGGRSTAPAWAAVGAVLVAAVVQGIQTFDPGYSPSVSGAFGSVFVGFTAVYFVHLLGALYWSETTAVAASRGDAAVATAEAESVSAFLNFLTAVMVIAFVLIYLVS